MALLQVLNMNAYWVLQGLLKAGQLHHAVQELILFYHRKFDMQFPPLNWPIMLFHYIKRLALPSTMMNPAYSHDTNNPGS